MAVPASSTSLDWQLEEANTLNINRGALDAGIRKACSQHLLHSDKLLWPPTFFFCKGRNKQEKIISVMN